MAIKHTTFITVARDLLTRINDFKVYIDSVAPSEKKANLDRKLFSGVKESFNKNLRAKKHLHKKLAIPDPAGSEVREHDHAVPLDVLFDYGMALDFTEENVQRMAAVYEHCLVTVELSHGQHRQLNMQLKDELPPGNSDLLICDVLARYSAVFPEYVADLRTTLASL